MAPDVDAFEGAYRRLAGTRVGGAAGPSEPPGAFPPEPGAPRPAETPRSRLLPRLALMAPRRRPTPFDR